MPELRKQQRANEAELQSPEMTAVDPTHSLRLVETLAEFRARLRARGNVPEVAERQRVVRLLVHEILVSRDNITIHHSIPMPGSSPDSNDRVRPSLEPPEPNSGSCYLCVQTVNTPETMFPDSSSRETKLATGVVGAQETRTGHDFSVSMPSSGRTLPRNMRYTKTK